jgi:hypothetical protein
MCSILCCDVFNLDLINFRQEKISKMCSVMGIDSNSDPDPTYELTADNVKKMMAVYMRLRWSKCFCLDVHIMLLLNDSSCVKGRNCSIDCLNNLACFNLPLLLILLLSRGNEIKEEMRKTKCYEESEIKLLAENSR